MSTNFPKRPAFSHFNLTGTKDLWMGLILYQQGDPRIPKVHRNTVGGILHVSVYAAGSDGAEVFWEEYCYRNFTPNFAKHDLQLSSAWIDQLRKELNKLQPNFDENWHFDYTLSRPDPPRRFYRWM